MTKDIMTRKIKLGIFGIKGKLGKVCADLALNRPEFELIGGTTRTPDLTSSRFETDDALKLARKCDILLDVGHRSQTLANLSVAIKLNVPLVCGVTGHTPEELDAITQAATKIPLLLASNFSPALAVFANLAQLAGMELPADRFDAHIDETHHRRKLDAPSGTAKSLALALDPSGKRPIGFSSTRGGGVVGEHVLRFLGDKEEIALSHRAFDRSLFGSGALLACEWLMRQGVNPSGKPWSMRDAVAS